MEKKLTTVTVTVEKTNTGFSAYSEDLGAYGSGATLAELKTNMVSACNGQLAALGQSVTEEGLKMVLDLPQFFEYYKVINVSALASRIGMAQSLLAQYIGGQKKPSAKQTTRILEGVRAVGRELAAVDFV